MLKNINLLYIIIGLEYSWFWVGVWVPYYLLFTDYSGIGLIEAIITFTLVITEIPTGAISDLLGRKKTILVALLVGFLGYLTMGFATNYGVLLTGVTIVMVGFALTSGTYESILYDSLLEEKQEGKYEKILTNISSIKLFTLAFCSILGGFIYQVMPGLPYLLLAAAKLIAIVFALKLIEPHIDSEKFSFKQYIKQTYQGFKELKKNFGVLTDSVVIILLTIIIIMNDQMLIDIQIFDQGWSEEYLGIISSIMFFTSGIIVQGTKLLVNKFGVKYTNLITATSIGLTMLVVPYLGLILATGIIIFRNGLLEIFTNTASKIINKNTSSKNRATTLSTYNLLSNLPYAILALVSGALMADLGVGILVQILGVTLLLFSLIGLFAYSNTFYSLVTRK